jgi:hypothetical protein
LYIHSLTVVSFHAQALEERLCEEKKVPFVTEWNFGLYAMQDLNHDS